MSLNILINFILIKKSADLLFIVHQGASYALRPEDIRRGVSFLLAWRLGYTLNFTFFGYWRNLKQISAHSSFDLCTWSYWRASSLSSALNAPWIVQLFMMKHATQCNLFIIFSTLSQPALSSLSLSLPPLSLSHHTS